MSRRAVWVFTLVLVADAMLVNGRPPRFPSVQGKELLEGVRHFRGQLTSLAERAAFGRVANSGVGRRMGCARPWFSRFVNLRETEAEREQPVLLADGPRARKAEALAQPQHGFGALDGAPRCVEGLEAAHPRHRSLDPEVVTLDPLLQALGDVMPRGAPQQAGFPALYVPHKSLSLVSRRLHAGRRSASRQASAELCRRPTTGAWFWRRPYAFDTSATVHSRSSDQRTPDGIAPAFCRNAHHLGHWTDAACGGLDPDPAIRARGADPHLLCSKAARS